MSTSLRRQAFTDRAVRRTRTGDYDGAAADYAEALAGAELASAARAHVLAKLAEVERLGGALEKAEATARAARELAAASADDGALAHSGFALGTVLLGRFESSEEEGCLGVQGRIRAALGFVFLEQELTGEAAEALLSAAERLLEAHDASTRPLLESIAQALADDLLDARAAASIRRRAEALAVV
jgi:hypothetical protein